MYHVIDYDKYYTPIDLAKTLIDKTFKVIGKENISEIIEPSAGSGAFSNQIENCIAYDLVPEAEGIIQADFLKLKLDYKEGRLFIGNPPFGINSTLLKAFINKCKNEGDYISFIVNSSFHNYNRFDGLNLIHSEYLGNIKYGDRKVKTSFVIYKREVDRIYKVPKIEFVESIDFIGRTNKDDFNFIFDGRKYKLISKTIKLSDSFNPLTEFDFIIGRFGGSTGKIITDKVLLGSYAVKLKSEYKFLLPHIVIFFKDYHKEITHKRCLVKSDILEKLEKFVMD